MFTAPSYGDRTLNEVQRCVNLYPEKTPQGWKLVSPPGLSLLATVTNNTACRGAYHSSDSTYRLYSVHGDKVYLLNPNGSVSSTIGTLNTSSGTVFFAENPTQIFMVDSGFGYIITKSSGAFVAIGDANFPGAPAGAAFLDGYFITGSRTSGTFYLSALNDGTDWTPATSATAESRSDRNIDVRVANQQLIIIGTESQETWYNTGNASFPLERITGATTNTGTPDKDTIAQCREEIFYVGYNGTVWHLGGGQRRKISTPYIESRIGAWTYGTVWAFAYTSNGHMLYQVTNSTTDSTSWVYDLTTDSWHERTSSGTGYNRVRTAVNAFPTSTPWPYAFDAANGKVYALDEQTANSEDGTAITRIRTFGPIEASAKLIFHHRIRFVVEVDHDSSASYTLSATLEWSDNAGLSWSTARTMSKAITSGTTGQRVMLSADRLGSSRQRYYRLTFTGPAARLVLQSADLDMEVGRN
jgi:hypothetical protein